MRRRAETGVLLVGMAVTSTVVFEVEGAALLPFVTFPFVIWAAMRHGKVVTGIALAILGVVATAGTIAGSGPFNSLGQNPPRSAVELVAFLGTLTAVGLVVAETSVRRRASERSLALERDYVATLIEGLSDGVIVCDAEGNLESLNEAARAMHGRLARPLPPERWAENYDIYWPGTDVHPEKEEIPLYRALQGEEVHDVELDVAPADGARLTVSISGTPLRDAGQIRGAVVVMRDITDRKLAEAALLEAGQRWQTVFTESPVAIALVAPDLTLSEVNAAFSRLTGYSPQELSTMTFADITHPEDVGLDTELARRLLDDEIPTYEIEKRYITKNRRQIWVTVTAFLVRDAAGAPLYGVGVVQDITERKRFEMQLRHLADHDALTGLYNRRRLDQELERQVADSRRYGRDTALLLIDLDDFKQINDVLGHKVGDELLEGIGKRMARRLRSSDILARMGGDEFAVILPQASASRAQAVANALREAVYAERARGSEMPTRASVGIALHDDPAKTAEQLLSEADLALYAAKHAGGNLVRVYERELIRS